MRTHYLVLTSKVPIRTSNSIILPQPCLGPDFYSYHPSLHKDEVTILQYCCYCIASASGDITVSNNPLSESAAVLEALIPFMFRVRYVVLVFYLRAKISSVCTSNNSDWAISGCM